MIAVQSTLIALALAWCFAALGELILAHRAAGLAERNRAFLVGLSVTSVAFVPLSVVLSGKALVSTAICLFIAGLHGIWSRRKGSIRKPFQPQADTWSIVFLVVLILLSVQFGVQNIRLSYLWDGYQIWATKALMLYQHGALGKQWVAQGEPGRLVSYPHLVPLYEALIPVIQGRFEWEALKAPFSLFYLSLLISTFHSARLFLPQSIALGATALLALLPAVSTRSSIGGYADIPQAAFVAGTVAALLEVPLHATAGWRNAAPWLLGGLVFVKSEDVLLALIACATLVVCWLASSPAMLFSIARQHGGAVAVVIGCFVIRLIWVVSMPSQDDTYGPLDRAHFARAYENLLEVPRMCLQQMLNVSEWGVFWPAFLVAAIVVFVRGAERERAVAGGTAIALVVYMSIFYFTNWNISLHISQAFGRLLAQLSPAAVLTIGVAYNRLRGPVVSGPQPV